MEELTLIDGLCRLRTDKAAIEGPLVSVVVANRDGAHHVRRLLDGLDRRTNYRSFELVVVDNASRDESNDLIRAWNGPTTIIRNSENKSYSESNNQGIRAAQGELVLLANNDIDPIHPDWLGYMVETLTEDVAAVGAMLVYPQRPRREQPPNHPDLTVQHLGVAFQRSKWGVRAANLGAGSSPLSITAPGRRIVPAATAACLLVRRDDLIEHPLDERYWYGTEDWDLCLRLAQRGSIAIDERAVLFHHEYGTQDEHMSAEWLEARTRNHRWFNELWGPSLRRQIRAETVAPPTAFFYRDRSPLTALILAGKLHDEHRRRLVDGAERLGWHTSGDERRGGDLAIACDVPKHVHRFGAHDLSIAVVLDRHDAWSRSGALDSATHVLVPDARGLARLDAAWGRSIARIEPTVTNPETMSFDALLDAAKLRPDTMRIGVSTAAPNWHKAQMWGDTFLSRGLMRAFRRLGHETSELIRPDWSSSRAASCDLIVHLRGLHRRPVARGQWNVLWIISHPDRLEPGECDDYDVVACASRAEADRLTAQLGRPVHFLPQATDADTFGIGPRNVDFEVPVLYVGIARWPNRRAPRWMARKGRDFHLYGRNWEDYDEGRLLRDEYIANRDLPTAYRSASIVVADHHGSMRSGGFVANRLFDVFAAGGCVISDDVYGLDDLFDGTVPTYSDAEELEIQIRSLLADAERRRGLASRGRQIVEDRHTLDHRAFEILKLVDQA